MNKNKHTDLDGLIDLDSRSLIKLGNSAVVSIPSADDLGIIGNIDELDVREIDTSLNNYLIRFDNANRHRCIEFVDVTNYSEIVCARDRDHCTVTQFDEGSTVEIDKPV